MVNLNRRALSVVVRAGWGHRSRGRHVDEGVGAALVDDPTITGVFTLARESSTVLTTPRLQRQPGQSSAMPVRCGVTTTRRSASASAWRCSARRDPPRSRLGVPTR